MYVLAAPNIESFVAQSFLHIFVKELYFIVWDFCIIIDIVFELWWSQIKWMNRLSNLIFFTRIHCLSAIEILFKQAYFINKICLFVSNFHNWKETLAVVRSACTNYYINIVLIFEFFSDFTVDAWLVFFLSKIVYRCFKNFSIRPNHIKIAIVIDTLATFAIKQPVELLRLERVNYKHGILITCCFELEGESV